MARLGNALSSLTQSILRTSARKACLTDDVPKIRMLQHIFLQMENDCSPRYSYCFAEETKNSQVSDLAKRALNADTLHDKVVLMHELWAAAGYPSLAKHKRQRQQIRQGTSKARRLGQSASSTRQSLVLSDSSSDIEVYGRCV